MGTGAEAQERVAAFWRVIEAYAPVSFSLVFRTGDYERAKQRIVVPGMKLNWVGSLLNNPYTMGVARLLEDFHSGRSRFDALVPIGEPVNFIFDSRTEKASILAVWDRYVSTTVPGFRECVGATPRFENEEQFLPLQAADLWAGLTRRAFENAKGDVAELGFPGLIAKKDRYTALSQMTEDHLTRSLMAGLHIDLPGIVIYDLGPGVPRPVNWKTFALA